MLMIEHASERNPIMAAESGLLKARRSPNTTTTDAKVYYTLTSSNQNTNGGITTTIKLAIKLTIKLKT